MTIKSPVLSAPLAQVLYNRHVKRCPHCRLDLPEPSCKLGTELFQKIPKK